MIKFKIFITKIKVWIANRKFRRKDKQLTRLYELTKQAERDIYRLENEWVRLRGTLHYYVDKLNET